MGWGLGLGFGCIVPCMGVVTHWGQEAKEEKRRLLDEECRRTTQRYEDLLRREGYDKAYKKAKEDALAALCKEQLV